MNYLVRLRLHRVRQALLAATQESTTVSVEALNGGFWHFGELLRAYRECSVSCRRTRCGDSVNRPVVRLRPLPGYAAIYVNVRFRRMRPAGMGRQSPLIVRFEGALYVELVLRAKGLRALDDLIVRGVFVRQHDNRIRYAKTGQRISDSKGEQGMRPIHHRCAHVAALLVLSAGQSFADPVAPSAPPVARVEAVTESHFGDKVTDPYRWMENDQDRDWLTFLRGQNDYTRSVLDALPTRKGLLARIQQLSADITAPGQVRRSGGRLFFQQRPAGANNYKLFVREGGKDRLLVDPTALDTTDSHYSLDWWVPSPDGTKLAYGLSKDGSEDSTLQIMEVATGRILPERIPNTQYGFVTQWNTDGSGFFYNQLTGRVGTPSATWTRVFGITGSGRTPNRIESSWPVALIPMSRSKESRSRRCSRHRRPRMPYWYSPMCARRSEC